MKMNMDMNKYNKYTLAVMEDLKRSPYFFKKNSIIQYDLIQEEFTDELMRISKVQAVWDLRDLGAIKIHNQERIGLDYEFALLIIHDAFDGIYRRCIEEIKDQSLEEYENKRKSAKQKLALKKLLGEVIQTRKIVKKQRALLEVLSNFNPVSTKVLEEKADTDNLKSLIKDTRKKLHGSVFSIDAVRVQGVKKVDFYKLTYTAPIIKP